MPVSDTIYSRIFFVKMTDLRTKKPVYEATVKSKGDSPTVAAVAPCMIKMLFDDFPVSSGSTDNASNASAECDAR